MNRLKKLAIILRALGLNARVIDEKDFVSEDVFLLVKAGKIQFDIWDVTKDGQEDTFELHLYVNNELIYDTLYAYTQLGAVGEISKYMQFA